MSYSTDPSHRMERPAPPPTSSRSASPTPRPTSTSASTSEPPARKGNSKTRRNKEKSSKNRAMQRRKQREEGRGDPLQRSNLLLSQPHCARRARPHPVRPQLHFPSPPRGSSQPQMLTPATHVTQTNSFANTDAGIYLGMECEHLIHRLSQPPLTTTRRTTIPITDSEGRIVAVLVGRPRQGDWDSVHRRAFNALKRSRRRCRFPKKTKKHRRGSFAALNCGISHGGGQKVRGNHPAEVWPSVHLAHGIEARKPVPLCRQPQAVG